MAWKRSDSLFTNQFRRHGLDAAILAGTVCQEAERLYPELFKATALVEGTLRISVVLENQLAFRRIEGKLLQDLQVFSTEKQLPVPTRVRLTVIKNSDTL